jgi:YVTN family beta-propeller protein
MAPTNTRRALAIAALLGLTTISACSKEKAVEETAPGALAYVTNQNGNITVIDLNTFEPVSEINADGRGPRGIGVTEDGEMLVVANVDSGDISVIDRKSGKLIKHVSIGKNPEFVRVRDGRAYVSFEPASEGGPPPKPGSEEAKALAEKREEEGDQPARVAVVDLKEGKVIKEITGGMETEGIEFSADGSKIIVTNALWPDFQP